MTTDDTPKDLKSITVSEYGAANIRSDLMYATIENSEDVEFGVQVHRDGSSIALSAGTTYPDEPALYAYCGLTVEQAREVADAINQAADAAEEAAAKSPEEPAGKSLIQKLLG